MKINRNITGSFLVGLAVIGLAFGASAVNQEKASDKANPGKFAPAFLVNKGAQYESRASVDPIQNCELPDPKTCVYEVTSAGSSNIPNLPSYTAAQLQDYADNGWVTPHPGAENALYSD